MLTHGVGQGSPTFGVMGLRGVQPALIPEVENRDCRLSVRPDPLGHALELGLLLTLGVEAEDDYVRDLHGAACRLLKVGSAPGSPPPASAGRVVEPAPIPGDGRDLGSPIAVARRDPLTVQSPREPTSTCSCLLRYDRRRRC